MSSSPRRRYDPECECFVRKRPETDRCSQPSGRAVYQDLNLRHGYARYCYSCCGNHHSFRHGEAASVCRRIFLSRGWRRETRNVVGVMAILRRLRDHLAADPQFTVCTNGDDVLPLMFAVPPYTTVMV
jgi:hypothetical protein